MALAQPWLVDVSHVLDVVGGGRFATAVVAVVVAAPVLAVGVAIGVSRTVVGVHWPTDVLGGWALGGAWMLACASVAVLAHSRRATRSRGAMAP